MTFRTVCFLAAARVCDRRVYRTPEILTLGVFRSRWHSSPRMRYRREEIRHTRARRGRRLCQRRKGCRRPLADQREGGRSKLRAGRAGRNTNGRFEKGIDKSGAAHFEDRAVNWGATLSQGIQARGEQVG